MSTARRHAGSGRIRRVLNTGDAFGPPSLTSFDVATGSEVGGTTINVGGKNFVAGATQFRVGGVLGTNITVTDSQHASFKTPSLGAVHFVGRAVFGDYRDLALSSTAADNTCDISVTTPAGTATAAAAFTYTSEIARILAAKYSKEHRASDPRIGLNGSGVSSSPCFFNNGAAAQGTAANQPTFSATSFNGGPGITFDGSNDYLDATLPSSVSANNRPYLLVVYARVAGASKFLASLQDISGTADALLVGYGATNHVGYRQKNSAFDLLDTGVALDTGRHAMEVGAAVNTEPSLRWDGVNKVTSTTHDYVPDSALTHLVLGATLSGAVPFSPANGTIALVLVASSMLTTQELADVQTFLNGTWFPGYTGGRLL